MMASGDWEDYVYPATNVLRNKAGIQDLAELQKFERGVTAIRVQELRENPIRGDFSLAHMQAMHEQIFKDVYEWAGKIRTVDIAKGKGPDRTVFTYTEKIPEKAAEIQAIIKEANYGRDQNTREFAETMAKVYTAVNKMHPFREGNGRVAREYMQELAQQSGRTLDYTKVQRELWNEAAKESAHDNLGPIRRVFEQVSVVERAQAFERLAPSEALAKHPELDGAFKAVEIARQAGVDIARVREEVARDLHDGRIVRADVSVAESQSVIDHAAAHRQLIVRDAAAVGGTFRGEVVATSTHHVLLRTNDMMAMRYERDNLARDVYQGENLTIRYDAQRSPVYTQGHEPVASREDRGMQMERELVPDGGR